MMKNKKNSFINNERNIVHMNEKEFKIFYKIYSSQKPLYLRDIVEKTNLAYGTVQGIINRNIELFNIVEEGRNKYFSFKQNLDHLYLKTILEIENTRIFIKKYKNLKQFILEIKKLNLPILIFGSFSKGNINKNSDLDIIIFSDNEIKLPEHLSLYKLHVINVKLKEISKFKNEILYKEILKSHIIISGFEFILTEVLENE